DANGNVVQSYVYGENGQLLAMKKGNVTYFYHYNAHGDVIALTDAQGNVVARYEYDTWGQIRSQTGALATENPYRYAGYQYDEETGLYYLIARYYYPTHGVFLSMDPDPGDSDDILTQNGYTYANNNPVMLVDPDGHFVWMAINAGFAAYDGYKAYKSGKGWKGVAVAAAFGFVGGGKFKLVRSTARYIIKGKRAIERYNRIKHYGRTPTPKVRKAVLKRDNYTCHVGIEEDRLRLITILL
ncbi:RHS repeat-associated core domain-containing protein, partial [Anoxybacteroides rupiense]|uniref:RHS repeat-associated core domain-containing protein n=1 Tax=Anoxybacteroides rupiense TaxID=311460 RepID=UPI00366D4AEE